MRTFNAKLFNLHKFVTRSAVIDEQLSAKNELIFPLIGAENAK